MQPQTLLHLSNNFHILPSADKRKAIYFRCCIISVKEKKEKKRCEDSQWNINDVKCQTYFSALDTSHYPPADLARMDSPLFYTGAKGKKKKGKEKEHLSLNYASEEQGRSRENNLVFFVNGFCLFPLSGLQ